MPDTTVVRVYALAYDLNVPCLDYYIYSTTIFQTNVTEFLQTTRQIYEIPGIRKNAENKD